MAKSRSGSSLPYVFARLTKSAEAISGIKGLLNKEIAASR